MWKVFAIFCVLLPGGDCEKKYEFPKAFYNTQEECMVRAEYKAEEIAVDEVASIEVEIEALNAAQNLDIDMAEAVMRVEVGSKV